MSGGCVSIAAAASPVSCSARHTSLTTRRAVPRGNALLFRRLCTYMLVLEVFVRWQRQHNKEAQAAVAQPAPGIVCITRDTRGSDQHEATNWALTQAKQLWPCTAKGGRLSTRLTT